MNIIQKKWEFLNSTLDFAPLQTRKLFRFGLETLVARDIGSLRASARTSPRNWHTAKSNSYRLTKNESIIPVFKSILAACHGVTADDRIAVDFSDFGNDMQVLTFAKQTNRGRALPLYFEVLRYPVTENSQNTFIINAARHFEAVIGCKPMLVFDRGFACPSIIKYLFQNQWDFVIRVKQMKHAEDPKTGMDFPIRDAKEDDRPVTMYDGLPLRIVRSDQKEDMPQPWYLVTNNTALSREKIIDIYYHRFEIEEFFRDAKRLLGLEWVTFKLTQSLSVVLWFVILGVWCLRHLETKLDELRVKEREMMQLSGIRYLAEKIKASQIFAAEREYLIPQVAQSP